MGEMSRRTNMTPCPCGLIFDCPYLSIGNHPLNIVAVCELEVKALKWVSDRLGSKNKSGVFPEVVISRFKAPVQDFEWVILGNKNNRNECGVAP